MGRHLTRWLIPLPAILFAVFPNQANAEPISGLNAVGYTISQIPPSQSDDLYPVCHSELENNINRNFNGEPFGDCPNDMFMVHYTGFIEIPANNTIKFMIAADDGGTVKIGTTEFGTWNDKGCSWSAQTSNIFEAGIGYTYDAVNDVFICPQPYPSWVLDENFDWQPPTPMPVEEGKRYAWFEPNRVWIELV